MSASVRPPATTRPHLVAGTAQLGLPYGIANTTGMPDRPGAIRIIRAAIAAGVTRIDTARAYGEAESRLGEALASAGIHATRVVTKLDPLTAIAPGAPQSEVLAAVDASIRTSREHLRIPRLPVLLLHRWEHRHAWSGAVWRRLLRLRDQGDVETIGASVYTPQEALEALRDPDVGHLQLPFNIIDRRWKAAGVDELAATRMDVVIDIRSVFLQGALIMDPGRWTEFLRTRLDGVIDRLDALTSAFGREGRADLCLAYARAQPWIDGIVIGMETEVQLEDNLRLFARPPLPPEQCRAAEVQFGDVAEEVLNPSQWRLI